MTLSVGIFLVSALVLLYIMLGYPLVLAWLARRKKPVLTRFEPKTVSVLLAVRNGEKWLRRKLDSILALHYPHELLQILVISDGSTDSTEDIAREYASRGVQLIATPAGGKCQALNEGMRHATGEILFFTDVRQTLDPDSLKHLVACFADPSVGVVSGELLILDESGQEDSGVGLYWRYEKWIRKNLSNLDSLFGATGSIYAMRRELASALPPDCLLDDVYLPLKAFFPGYRLILEEKARAYDIASSLDVEFRRKVRTLAGVYQVIGAYPALLTPRNRLLFHFLSHKFGRLLLPFAVLALGLSSLTLPEQWRTPALWAQGAFYILALTDPWLPLVVRRLSSHTRSFVVFMFAAICAVAILFVPPHRLWRHPSN
jgi:cellulose synthase/poly-beta-1,6-N-acetylglucosamine synthase-like glycosyltransferase